MSTLSDLPRTPLARFAAVLAGAALFCAPGAWAQEAVETEDEDFNRFHVSIGFYNSGLDCAAPASALTDRVRDERPTATAMGEIACSESQSFAGIYGFQFTKRLGVEMGQIIGPGQELGAAYQEAPSSSSSSSPLFYSTDTEYFTLYIGGTLHFGGSDWVKGYAMAGLAAWDSDITHSVSVFARPSRDSYDFESDAGLIYGLGALFDIGGGFGIRLGYKAVTGADVRYTGTELVYSF